MGGHGDGRSRVVAHTKPGVACTLDARGWGAEGHADVAERARRTVTVLGSL
jgi:hypothetical protein